MEGYEVGQRVVNMIDGKHVRGTVTEVSEDSITVELDEDYFLDHLSKKLGWKR